MMKSPFFSTLALSISLTTVLIGCNSEADINYEENDSSGSSYESNNSGTTSTPSPNLEDYNSDGEYKPVKDMTQEEIEAELEEILGDSLEE
ncbi:hypothetical protein [Pseudalkalibacillus hwajinpoensis]|uniref:hypothetical protein n=1 Tax=Guptibacillus hwajinpoensis TaxID=208199 RepID=UPI001CD51259|nr:hypothetical protein [Pseudalkalibacillus hwajinpoensis]MCA0991407.1 hypothetical protein [Pseudalkalibacillus hwajinpoensis]